MNRFLLTLLAMGLIAGLTVAIADNTGLLFAADDHMEGDGAEEGGEAEEGYGGMSEEEMQELWMRLSSVGEHHEMIAEMTGEWDIVERIWMGGPEPSEFTGTMTGEAILGGRFVRMTYEAPMQMSEEFTMDFVGECLLGFDNYRSSFQSTWCDNMSTALFTSAGTAMEDGRIVLYGQNDDPWTGVMDSTYKYEYSWQDENTFTLKMWDLKQGDDAMMMEIVHTRAE